MWRHDVRCHVQHQWNVFDAGLDLDSDVIIEIAVIITDGSLQKRIMVSSCSLGLDAVRRVFC